MFLSWIFLTSLRKLVVTVITHFGHAVFHVFQRISVPGAASTDNLCQAKYNVSYNLLRLVYQILKCIRTLRFISAYDSLSRSRGSGVCEEWGWNPRCSSYTSSLLRPEQVWELSLLETGTDDLSPATHTCFNTLEGIDGHKGQNWWGWAWCCPWSDEIQ